MKTWLSAATLAIALCGAAFGEPAHAGASGSTTTPPIIIQAQGHGGHAAKFAALQGKDANLRSEINKKGYDVAFTEWMQRDHAMEYAAVCVKMAHKVYVLDRHSSHKAEFESLLHKKSDLRAAVDAYGKDVAFADWLQKTHPDDFNKVTQAPK